MRIVTTRRISQIFFSLLFFWFCVVTTLGEQWWQLRGWPVNWLIQLDPLVGLATVLTTGTLYAGLLWGLLTLLLTMVLGRFFCGWICPFGALHQIVGWVANLNRKTSERIAVNRYRKAQGIKYAVLAFLLAAAAGEVLGRTLHIAIVSPALFLGMAMVLFLFWANAKRTKKIIRSRWIFSGIVILVVWVFLGLLSDGSRLLAASLQTGLLDPIPLFYRSINLTLLPLLDGRWVDLNPTERIYPGTWAIGILFWSSIFLNLFIPRFYCRFICPLGALFGLFGKNAIWRMGQKNNRCTACKVCDQFCEGGCDPSSVIHTPECLLCMNCLTGCQEDVIGYHFNSSLSGEASLPDISKRAWMTSVVSGLAAVSLARLNGMTGSNWNPSVIRPPGSLPEEAFLQRCIKCGQCMRICPTNVIQPSGFQSGIEGIWTPSLNFRMGTSGCQEQCIACGNLCPTAAIRPISLDERLGKGEFTTQGPVRIGTAFIDHGRCLPWAMDRPCIVCQENCPVSPKAIFTRKTFRSVQLEGRLRLQRIDGNQLIVDGSGLPADLFSTGDYYVSLAGYPEIAPARITRTGPGSITLVSNPFAKMDITDSSLLLSVRLQLPFVDPAKCIGCGVCEHECPVKGKRAIRVTAENETREREHKLVL